ncbi:2TM domain-containing protein [Ulvibacterium sp.]|uniref:2TM domain-containing protein n=1 Tax=Ulvibacterium sp. TaxID=2665914 RepID=UPI0026206F11|nr:2TM domain-containing protein [Ulvibacterium sp.]
MTIYPSERFTKAKKRVDKIKGFYKHLSIYIVANILLFIFKGYALSYLISQGIKDQGFLDWFTLNIILTPVLWGLGLIIHGFLAFRTVPFSLKNLKPKFIEDWEERQIQKYMNAEGDSKEEL